MKALRSLPRLLWPLLLAMTKVPASAAAPEPDRSLAGDGIDQLSELASRRPIKPYELLRTSAGKYPSERTIFRDVKTGTVIWKMSRNPGYNYLVWVELKGEGAALKQALRVGWDGTRPATDIPMWDYVATGHDQPSSIAFFDTLKSDSQCNPWYEFKAGPYRVTLAMPGAKGTLLSLTVTNDAGYVPDGITSFRNSP